MENDKNILLEVKSDNVVENLRSENNNEYINHLRPTRTDFNPSDPNNKLSDNFIHELMQSPKKSKNEIPPPPLAESSDPSFCTDRNSDLSDTDSVNSAGSDSSTSDVENLEEKLLTITAEMTNIELKDKLSGEDTSEEELESIKWLQKESERLRNKLLSKLPEDKKDQWMKKGTDLLAEHGLIQIGNDVKDRIIIKGTDILEKNPELKKKMISIMNNTNAIDNLQKKVGEVMENNKEIIDKAQSVVQNYVNDDNSKLV